MTKHTLAALSFLVIAGCATDDDQLLPTDDSGDELLADPAIAEGIEDMTPDDVAELAAHANDTRVDGVLSPIDRATPAREAAKFRATVETISPDSDQAAASRVVTHQVHVTGYKQSRSYFCVPASSRTVLSHWDSTPPSQLDIARREKTIENHGTYMVDVPPALNHYQGHNTFLRSTIANTADLLNVLSIDVTQIKSAMIAAVRGKDLPTWAAHGFDGFHGIVLYGYVQNGSTYYIKTWDPLHVSWSGAHAFRAYKVAKATIDNAGEVVW